MTASLIQLYRPRASRKNVSFEDKPQNSCIMISTSPLKHDTHNAHGFDWSWSDLRCCKISVQFVVILAALVLKNERQKPKQHWLLLGLHFQLFTPRRYYYSTWYIHACSSVRPRVVARGLEIQPRNLNAPAVLSPLLVSKSFFRSHGSAKKKHNQ